MTDQQSGSNPLRLILSGVGIGVLKFALLGAAGAQLLGFVEFVAPSNSLYFAGGAIVLAYFLRVFGAAWVLANDSHLEKANWPWVRLAIAVGGGLAIMTWQGGFSTTAPGLSRGVFAQIGMLILVTFACVKLRKLAKGWAGYSKYSKEDTQASQSAELVLDAAIGARRSSEVTSTRTSTIRSGQLETRPRSFSFGKRRESPNS
jgi:hypothetical protein